MRAPFWFVNSEYRYRRAAIAWLAVNAVLLASINIQLWVK